MFEFKSLLVESFEGKKKSNSYMTRLSLVIQKMHNKIKNINMPSLYIQKFKNTV
jgi:hypothetical protein